MRVRWKTSVVGQTFAFMNGQILTVPGLTEEVRTWLRRGWVDVLPDTETEAATVAPAEQAVVRKARRRPV